MNFSLEQIKTFAQQIDLISFLIGIGLIIILFVLFLLIRKIFKRKPEFNLKEIKQSLMNAHEFLAATNKELNDVYVFIDKIEKRIREMQG